MYVQALPSRLRLKTLAACLAMQVLSKQRSISNAHRSPVQKLYYCEHLDRFVACCQDGSFGFWNAQDMSHHRTFQHKGVWANDCIYLPVKRLLACASFNDTVSLQSLCVQAIPKGNFELQANGKWQNAATHVLPSMCSCFSNTVTWHEGTA